MSLEACFHRGQARAFWLLAALLAGGCDRPATEPPPQGTPAAAERVSEEISIELPGTPQQPGYLGVVVARESVDVAAEVAGRVESVVVRPGDRVERGDLVARLDRRELAQGLVMAEASLSAVEAEVERSRVELQEARTRYERRAKIPDTFSREELAAAELEMQTAEAAHQAAVARANEQKARVGQLRDGLQRTDVRAPFGGTVALRYLDPGATAAAGSPLVRLITSDELLVRFAVPPEEAAALGEGAAVDIALETTGGTVPGQVVQVSPEIDSASQMVFMEARLASQQAGGSPVRSGLVARVHPAG